MSLPTPFERLLSTIEDLCKTASSCPHAAPMKPEFDIINKKFTSYIAKCESARIMQTCIRELPRNKGEGFPGLDLNSG